MQQTSVVLPWCGTKLYCNRSCFSSKLLLLTVSSVPPAWSHLGSMPAWWWPAGAVFHLMIVRLRTKWKYVKTGAMCDLPWAIITAVPWLQRYFLAPAPVTQIGMNRLRLHLKWDKQAGILILANVNFPHNGKSRQHSTDDKLGCGPLFLSPALKIQLKTTFFSVCLKTNLYDASLGTKGILYLLQPHGKSFMFGWL